MNANNNPTNGNITLSINLKLLLAEDINRKFIAVINTAIPIASLVNVADGGTFRSLGSNFRKFINNKKTSIDNADNDPAIIQRLFFVSILSGLK